jgi:hypothetical protein
LIHRACKWMRRWPALREPPRPVDKVDWWLPCK